MFVEDVSVLIAIDVGQECRAECLKVCVFRVCIVGQDNADFLTCDSRDYLCVGFRKKWLG